jgi:DnaJ-class molecular chaperone
MVKDSLPDHYGGLNVPRTATQREISSAYRRLMRTHHPDTGSGIPDNHELLRIMEAFAVLRNPVTRAAYDLAVRRFASSAADAAGSASTGLSPSGAPQVVPVRVVHPGDGPLIRVSPVRWESGPGSPEPAPPKEGSRNE